MLFKRGLFGPTRRFSSTYPLVLPIKIDYVVRLSQFSIKAECLQLKVPLQTTTYEKRALTLLVSAPAVYPCQLLMQPDCQTHSEWRNNTPPTSNHWESTHYCSFSNYSFSIAFALESQDFSFSPQISTFKTYIQNYSMIFAPVNKILTAGLWQRSSKAD